MSWILVMGQKPGHWPGFRLTGVTGVLPCDGKRLLQYIEGSDLVCDFREELIADALP
ncbi:hypothetical protein [Stenotrophomonas oahuensis]|uniref:Uncharacterized protein n=1 Tax=Stenotrophomonas oahuensis TaxID=3003271 RepID=A0ABY9YM61_9GAMM|nr:hypothetical protein [Stenotrophomonas sp. A5586]WNH51802.1 hypothetical protein PDM29_15845 [Stenotrophomonas sp. A5586]